MANMIQSNPVYYSMGALNSNDQSIARTVILHRRSDYGGFGVYIGEDFPSGLYVVTVERNSPAADANIQPGDRVLAFNGQSVASIQNNPKEKLMQVAANAHSLSLTIKSTDMYQSLQIPLVNNSKTNINNQNQNQNVRHYTSRNTIDSSTDLEGYIRSLFGDASIQILQAGTENDIKPPAIPFRQHTNSSKSLPTHHESKKSHRSHRNRRKRSKRITLVNVETQTLPNNNENESEQQLSPTSLKPNNLSRPNMGVSQIVSKNQSSNGNNNNKILEKSKPLEFSGISSSSSSSERVSTSAEKSKQTQSSAGTSGFNNSSATNPTMPHMSDVVMAAMNASRDNQKPDSRSQVAQKSEANKQPPATIYTATTGRDQVQPTGRDQVQSSGRDQVQPTGRDQVQSSGRDQPKPTGRDQVQPSGRDQIQPTGRDQVQPTGRDHPPPYTESANNPVAVNNQPSANEGSYNVPKGQINQTAAASVADTTRNLHLVRQPNFQGFGFHIQYNKKYYLIQSVESNSPAASADLQPNDVILHINGQKTDNMPHATFVQIVNSSQAVDFVVQPASDYLRANPTVARSQTTATTTVSTAAAQALANQDDDKNKTSLSKALGKFSIR